jgi:hypothetical protein
MNLKIIFSLISLNLLLIFPLHASLTVQCPPPGTIISTLNKIGLHKNFLEFDMTAADGVTRGLYKVPFFYTSFGKSDTRITSSEGNVSWSLTCTYKDPVADLIFEGTSKSRCCIGSGKKCSSPGANDSVASHCEKDPKDCTITCY